jgi:metal-sulfur cluster biosynthetic enzyme
VSELAPGWKGEVREALTRVLDPEVGFDVISMGLIRAITAEDDGGIAIAMTLTSPACPLGGQLVEEVAEAARQALDGAVGVTVSLVWEPPWGPGQMVPELRRVLGWDAS